MAWKIMNRYVTGISITRDSSACFFRKKIIDSTLQSSKLFSIVIESVRVFIYTLIEIMLIHKN